MKTSRAALAPPAPSLVFQKRRPKNPTPALWVQADARAVWRLKVAIATVIFCLSATRRDVFIFTRDVSDVLGLGFSQEPTKPSQQASGAPKGSAHESGFLIFV